jgi:AraC-like DNA-binding protein
MIGEVAFIPRYRDMSIDFPYHLEINVLDDRYPAHRHNYVELSYVIEGRARESVGGRSREIRPGSMTLVLPHHIHEIAVLSEVPLRLYNLCIGLDVFLDDTRARELFQAILYGWEYRNAFGLEVPGALQQRVTNTFDEMEREIREQLPWRRTRFYGLLIDLVVFFVRRCRVSGITAEATRESSAPPSPDERIWDVVNYVYRHYRRDLHLGEIADRFAISVPYLSARFKQATGEPFVSFLNELRVNHALGLLRHGEMSLTEIAYSCGYNSYSSFSRMFKKIHGASPRAIRDAPSAN